jgi:hypothetical protein
MDDPALVSFGGLGYAATGITHAVQTASHVVTLRAAKILLRLGAKLGRASEPTAHAAHSDEGGLHQEPQHPCHRDERQGSGQGEEGEARVALHSWPYVHVGGRLAGDVPPT